MRFFACGEYGSLTDRPHYHAIVFGLAMYEDELLKATWKKGSSKIYEATPESMAYVAKYTLKVWHSKDPDEWLRGRQPMFSQMSLRPPIGASFAKALGRSFLTRKGSVVLAANGLEKQVRINGQRYPLDRTMVKYLVEELALNSEQAKVIFKRHDETLSDGEKEKALGFHRKALRKQKAKARKSL